MAAAIPVQNPTSASLMLGKLSIIAGKYGKTDVRAIGSENRTSARMTVVSEADHLLKPVPGLFASPRQDLER